MSENYGKSIKTARLAAGLTQEQAAEVCGVSIESWRGYECSTRIPTAATVARMADELGAAWLALEYLKFSGSELGVLESEIPTQSLPTAVITLINRVFAFADRHRDRQLLGIAEDGVIDSREENLFAEIVRELDDIIGAALAVKFPKQKETAPTLARRSGGVQVLADQNDCKTILTRPRGLGNRNFTEGGSFR